MAGQNDRITGIPAPTPTDYDPQFNFEDWQDSNPGQPLPAQQLDAEFVAVEYALDETQARARLIQRDDGNLQNGIVSKDSLNATLIDLITAGGSFDFLADTAATPGRVPLRGAISTADEGTFEIDTAQKSTHAARTQDTTYTVATITELKAVPGGLLVDGARFDVTSVNSAGIRLYQWEDGNTDTGDDVEVVEHDTDLSGRFIALTGTAVTRDTGTDADQVPLNSDLDTAAYRALTDFRESTTLSATGTLPTPTAYGTEYVTYDAATGTLTLPTLASTPVGGMIVVVKDNTTQGAVDIDPDGSDAVQWGSAQLRLYADGNVWCIRRGNDRWELVFGTETGSDASGQFQKFYDGKMTQVFSPFTLTFFDSETLQYTWTYPVAFSSVPVVSITLTTRSASWNFSSAIRNVSLYGQEDSALSSSSCIFRALAISGYSFVSGDVAEESSAIAKGRWYE